MDVLDFSQFREAGLTGSRPRGHQAFLLSASQDRLPHDGCRVARPQASGPLPAFLPELPWDHPPSLPGLFVAVTSADLLRPLLCDSSGWQIVQRAGTTWQNAPQRLSYRDSVEKKKRSDCFTAPSAFCGMFWSDTPEHTMESSPGKR